MAITNGAGQGGGRSMFEISAQVAAAFALQSEHQFNDRLIGFLTEQFPSYTQDRGAVSAVVQLGIVDAQGFGLRSERALAMYCMLALLLGLDIKDDPRLRSLLLESGQKEEDLASSMGAWMSSIAAALEGA